MIKGLLPLLIILNLNAHSQRFEYVYRNPSDSSHNCYLKVIPNTKEMKGLIVRDYSNLPDVTKSSPYGFLDLCTQAGYMTLYTNTSTQFPELFTQDSTMALLDQIIHEVLEDHQIPKGSLFLGGISASGSRALRFAEYCASGKSDLKISGVFAVDSPLDLTRFYNSAKNHRSNFKEGMLWEADWMLPLFQKLFNGSPDEFPMAYQDASVFSANDSLGGQAFKLKSTPIILFHEPDIDWWLNERGATYYDFNSYDLAGFTLCLQQLGNTDITLITTTGKGFDRKGNRNCHSWTIVDEELLVNWIVDHTE
ncbi:hypothetical protein KFE98_04920 [bacterium SCSIO 12741]|nr:hypothetical protein KFE98_04920 [bacterium SCSIO 12741]